jgi:DNA helicase-2/ATP-dependent DNA helicase PcrA
VCPQGVFVRTPGGEWRRGGGGSRLVGGQGSAIRADRHHRPRLGLGPDAALEENKHLKEITGLIDARQFDLITAPSSGLVVIQGGAGSGKTTIGLHRLAYLAFQDARRFRPDRMLVVVFNDALARYIGQVLPALGVKGVAVRTYEGWASKLRVAHVPELTAEYSAETPGLVTRLKKHPAMLHAIDGYVASLEERIRQRLTEAVDRNYPDEWRERVQAAFASTAGLPLAHRLHALVRWVASKEAQGLSKFALHAIERTATTELRDCRDVVTAWAELLTDRKALKAALDAHAPGVFSDAELGRAVDWCTQRTLLALAEME